MVNSQLVAMEFQSMLPVFARPEHTAGYEGFIHLTDITGNVEKTVSSYIVRDHDFGKLRRMQEQMTDGAEFLNKKYGVGTVTVSFTEGYRNMKEQMADCMYIVERAAAAMRACGIEPHTVPIRGGTDGAKLAYMGLPCPNIGTGSGNCHGRFEYVVAEDLEKNVDIITEILKTY